MIPRGEEKSERATDIRSILERPKRGHLYKATRLPVPGMPRAAPVGLRAPYAARAYTDRHTPGTSLAVLVGVMESRYTGRNA